MLMPCLRPIKWIISFAFCAAVMARAALGLQNLQVRTALRRRPADVGWRRHFGDSSRTDFIFHGSANIHSEFATVGLKG